jgi:hypothetical protein
MLDIIAMFTFSGITAIAALVYMDKTDTDNDPPETEL